MLVSLSIPPFATPKFFGPFWIPWPKKFRCETGGGFAWFWTTPVGTRLKACVGILSRRWFCALQSGFIPSKGSGSISKATPGWLLDERWEPGRGRTCRLDQRTLASPGTHALGMCASIPL